MYSKKIYRNILIAPFCTVVLIFALLLIWSKFEYPRSLNEARFLLNLRTVISDSITQINLAELMPGDWELVCESHGYDEPLHLAKYGKTFPAAGSPNGGAWGLIFINANGSYDLASSSCGQGIYLKFENARCIPRAQSILNLDLNLEGEKKCKSYKATYHLKPATDINHQRNKD